MIVYDHPSDHKVTGLLMDERLTSKSPSKGKSQLNKLNLLEASIFSPVSETSHNKTLKNYAFLRDRGFLASLSDARTEQLKQRSRPEQYDDPEQDGFQKETSFWRFGKEKYDLNLVSSDTDVGDTGHHSRVEVVMDILKKQKSVSRKDKIAGVPSEFSKKPVEVQFVEPIRIPSRRRKALEKRALKRAQSPCVSSSTGTTLTPLSKESLEDNSSRQSSRQRPRKLNIPGHFIFPKEVDFIPLERSRTVDEAGLGWRSGNATPLRLTTPASSEVRGRGNVYRNSYPVTEALHKEGTSVTKKKGVVPSGLDVTKVWTRKVDLSTIGQLIPTHILSDLDKITLNKRHHKQPAMAYSAAQTQDERNN